ncbi:uncharacterized protein FA14DRAFT_161114 [Meira miltonrushii]|uniref:Uncharacterized protein n=1 Tax=Meira miltonrushii TaxID=1280837 RepID=A0A316VFG1_9BASI|nr:uncharacterized protein FA14DRAFT_161114 [Meira miltonrushii]PWN36369.1 hypothetical protein FA14DRAFT_161114 [Meira miltonrushii]
MMTNSASTSQLPPPAYSDYDEECVMKYSLYFAHQTPSTSYHNGLTQFYLYDNAQRRFTYTAKVPKKREGWKADIALLTEKGREEARYEVRREPLARKFDFRPPNGMHNVMTPSVSAHRSFAIEAPDGQKLVWRKSHTRFNLISLPSNTVIVQYDLAQQQSHFNHTAAAGANPSNSATSMQIGDDASPALSMKIGEQEVRYHGMLSLSPLPATEPKSKSNTNTLKRSQSHTSITSSHSSSSGSDHGPRLYGAHRKGACVGLWGPGVLLAGFGSPLLAAGMNGNCLIGDELRNLGRATINAFPPGHHEPQRMQTDGFGRPIGTSSYEQAAEHWASLNRIEASAKNTDPRPRRVDMDLILASMIAVLTG